MKKGAKKRVSPKALKKSDFLQIRIEPEIKADFEEVAYQNKDIPSELLRTWIYDYINENKYMYYVIRTKEINVLIRAISESSAVNRLQQYYHQKGKDDLYCFDVTHCHKVHYPEALALFVKEAVRQTPLVKVDELLHVFNSSEMVLFEQENLYYITTKEQIDLDIKRAYEERTKGLPANNI